MKDHGVQMTKEKVILDNVNHSQQWFLQAYGKLKTACGGGLTIDVDFKEFTEILDCIQEPNQMREVLKIIDPDAPADSNPNPNLQNINPERMLMMQK